MEIKYFTQNIYLKGELKKFLEDKIKKLSRFSKNIWQVDVDLSYSQSHPKEKALRLEINLKMLNKILRAEIRAADLQTAINLIENKLRKQLEKYKEFGLVKRRLSSRLIREKKSL